MKRRQTTLLRIAFLVGAVTDGAALVPMLFPSVANFLWGVHGASASAGMARGYGASLMFGWTALLVWAYRRPMERRFVAALTVVVIAGLVLTEIIVVHSGAIRASRMAPTWCLQAGLLLLFASAYHFPSRTPCTAT